ncbi:MAG: hypothetical protein GY930_15400 [bacterium]|nr:hypothetical protein [bacterium]
MVRNPWDRAVSHYHHRIRTNQTGMGLKPPKFKDWLQLTLGEQDPTYLNYPDTLGPQVLHASIRLDC